MRPVITYESECRPLTREDENIFETLEKEYKGRSVNQLRKMVQGDQRLITIFTN